MEERLAKPFNESLDRSADEAIVYFRGDEDLRPSMSYGSMGSEFSVDEGEVVAKWINELKGYLESKVEPGSSAHTRDIVVCPAPAVLQMTLKNGYDVVITGGVIDKVMGGSIL